MSNWTVQKKFTLLLMSLIILLVMNIVSMLQISKTGYFTYLEREHLIGIETINLNIDKIKRANNTANFSHLIDNESNIYKEQGIKQGIKHAKRQAQSCLNAVNSVEILIFKMLGFGEAIDICTADIIVNDQLLEKIKTFQRDHSSKDKFLSTISASVEKLQHHTDRFAVLIPEIRIFMTDLIIFITVMLAIALILAFIFVLKSIQKTLKGLSNDMSYVESQSVLAYEVSTKTHCEIGAVGISFQSLLNKFANIVKRIVSSNKTLTEQSTNLKKLAEQSNTSVLSQSKMSEQISSAISHMTLAIQDVATTINTVASDVGKVDDSASTGQEVVSKTIEALNDLTNDISQASEVVNKLALSGEQVSNVLGVITQIADQTNLLALNAAIEAARAGEHGRGFAVVSDEVRTLATRTQDSTREISAIIADFKTGSDAAMSAMEISQNKAQKTLIYADSAGQSLSEIVNLSGKISDHANQVATAAEEQTTTLQNINSDVSTLAKSAAEAQKIANKTHEAALVMNKNVDEMHAMVSTFKT